MKEERMNLKDKIIEIVGSTDYITAKDIVKVLSGNYFKSPAYIYGYLSALADIGVIKRVEKSKTVVFYKLL